MAKIKYSALVSDVRNKLNGSVMSKNRYGSIVRNKVTPVNPQSSFQQNARQRLASLSSSFRALTAAQIAAWNNSGVNFPFTDIFGDVKHLSGQTLFVKLNANLDKIGSPRILTPPLAQGFPEIAVSGAVAEVETGENSEVSFMIDPAVVPTGYDVVVYATPSISRSINFIKNRFRYLGTFVPAAGKIDLLTDYTARFGLMQGDEVVHFKVALVNSETGQQSIPFSLSAAVVATP